MTGDKFTKGDWKYSEVIGGCFIYAGKRCALSYTSSPDEENRANARLMAASPYLYEAVVMSRNAIASLAKDSEPARNALAKIDDAISKARGE